VIEDPSDAAARYDADLDDAELDDSDFDTARSAMAGPSTVIGFSPVQASTAPVAFRNREVHRRP